MGTSIFLAKAFSIYFIIFSIIIFIRKKRIQAAAIELMESKSGLFMLGIITFILGILLVLVHPGFTGDWRSLITVFCWLTLIKGVAQLLAFPPMSSYKKFLIKKPHYLYISAVVMLVLGIYLGYHGFGW